MTDFDFYKEFAIRNSLEPVRTKTSMEIKKIAIDKQYIDVSTMFDDKSMNELYERAGRCAHLYAKAYRFIRDNQKLFIEAP